MANSKLPRGRPVIPIDWDVVDEHLYAGCDGRTIASKLGINEDTLYNRVKEQFGVIFSVYSAWKCQMGDDILKKAQFDKATGKTRKGDTTLLTFLGKVRLKQRENPEMVTSPNDPNLDFADAYMKSEAAKKQLEDRLAELEEQLRALKPQTDPIIQRSDEEIQYLGGGCPIGQDLLEHSETD